MPRALSLGSNGLYQHVTPAGAKCRVQQLGVRVTVPAPNVALDSRMTIDGAPRRPARLALRCRRGGVERECRRPHRPSKLDPCMAFATETLERFPALAVARLFDMVKARGHLTPRILGLPFCNVDSFMARMPVATGDAGDK